MPKVWFYFFALFLPLVLRALLLNIGFVEWLWYHDYQQAYYVMSQLRINPQFMEFLGGWALPFFTGTVCCYWMMHGGEGIPEQFLMLPIFYIPFTVLGDILMSWHFDASNLVTHPLTILPIGYAYVLSWEIFIRVMDKFRLVL